VGVQVWLYSPWCQMGMGGQGQVLAALPPRKSPDTHCRQGWVSHRAGLSMPLVFEPRTIQHVTHPYTDYTIPAPPLNMYIHERHEDTLEQQAETCHRLYIYNISNKKLCQW
jgi:hypothetical protein